MTDPIFKHTTSTDALDTLGTIIGPGERRDAVHIAAAPVIAYTALNPGERVAYDPDTNEARPLVEADDVYIGIVDPYLDRGPEAGEWFWLLVKPREITTLNHVWEHPAFAPSPMAEPRIDVAAVEDALEAIVPIPSYEDKAASEAWLREYLNPYYSDNDRWGMSDMDSFEDLIARAQGLDEGEGLHIRGRDASGSIDPEFWRHLAVYTGDTSVVTSQPRESYFTCGC